MLVPMSGIYRIRENCKYCEWDKREKTHGSHRDTSIQNENKNDTFRNNPDP